MTHRCATVTTHFQQCIPHEALRFIQLEPIRKPDFACNKINVQLILKLSFPLKKEDIKGWNTEK